MRLRFWDEIPMTIMCRFCQCKLMRCHLRASMRWPMRWHGWGIQGLFHKPVTFATGAGSRDGSDSCKVVGELSCSNECYLLKDSLWALSIGDQVRQGKAFVWLSRDSRDASEDAELPKPLLMKPENISNLSVNCPETSRCYASEVRENVRTFHYSKKKLFCIYACWDCRD